MIVNLCECGLKYYYGCIKVNLSAVLNRYLYVGVQVGRCKGASKNLYYVWNETFIPDFYWRLCGCKKKLKLKEMDEKIVGYVNFIIEMYI